MSYSKAKFVDMIDKAGTMFSWGLIDNVQPHRISYKNTPSAQNFRILEIEYLLDLDIINFEYLYDEHELTLLVFEVI